MMGGREASRMAALPVKAKWPPITQQSPPPLKVAMPPSLTAEEM
jgi:hypothetical protein